MHHKEKPPSDKVSGGGLFGYSSLHLNVEPLVFEAEITPTGEVLPETVRIRRIAKHEVVAEAALVDTRLLAKAAQMQESL